MPQNAENKPEKSSRIKAKLQDDAKTPDKTRRIPEKIVPEGLADYLEVMTIAVFQASMSWALIQNKWESFRTAFDNFDPEKIAKYNDAKINELMQNTGILRNEKKIKATIENARMMLSLEKEFGSLSKYLNSFESYLQLSKDLKKRFHYFGDLSIYYFLFRVGESVPDFDEWSQKIEGDHPRMREMVDKAKRNDKSKQR